MPALVTSETSNAGFFTLPSGKLQQNYCHVATHGGTSTFSYNASLLFQLGRVETLSSEKQQKKPQSPH